MALGYRRTNGGHAAPPPYVGAAVIVAGLAVLVAGMIWLNRDDTPTRLAMPTADGITLPTDSDGQAVDVPPSQPATAMSFGPGGQILRPDPTRARVVDDETGDEVMVELAPNTTIDAVTGDIIPTPAGGTGGTTVTTGGGGTTTPTTPPPTSSPTTAPPTTRPPTTQPPTTQPPTTQPPTTTTTTQPTTTTTQATTTTTAEAGPAVP